MTYPPARIEALSFAHFFRKPRQPECLAAAFSPTKELEIARNQFLTAVKLLDQPLSRNEVVQKQPVVSQRHLQHFSGWPETSLVRTLDERKAGKLGMRQKHPRSMMNPQACFSPRDADKHLSQIRLLFHASNSRQSRVRQKPHGRLSSARARGLRPELPRDSARSGNVLRLGQSPSEVCGAQGRRPSPDARRPRHRRGAGGHHFNLRSRSSATSSRRTSSRAACAPQPRTHRRHAVEPVTDYGVTHGRAVGIGMAVIFRGCVRAGLCRIPQALPVLEHLLEKFRFTWPLSIRLQRRFSRQDRSDKKSAGSAITLILPEAFGRCRTERTLL